MTAEWSISGPLGYAFTPEECAQIARAAQAFQAALPTAGGFLDHPVRVDGLGVVDSTIKVDWPQPGDAVIQLAPCEVCGFRDWPEGGMHAARSIHMRAHERQGQCIPEHLEGAEVAQWLADHPDHRLIKP